MWEANLSKALSLFGTRRVDGKVASERTQTLMGEVLRAAFRTLHQLGYKIQDPRNLGDRHIDVLVKHWWYCKQKKVKTIQNELSRLRVFCAKLGKPGMVRSVQEYLPEVDPSLLKVRTAAQTTKAWACFDIVKKFEEVDQRDSRFGLMLRLQLGFGLRREEVLKCNPHAQDFGSHLQIFPGMGKGGRWRNIPITTSAQRELLDYVKARSAKNKPLGWQHSAAGKAVTLEQNIRRYENLMAALGFTKADAGVTGHGLRAQFAENQSLILGLMPPTLGRSDGPANGDSANVAKIKLAQALGHNRPSVTSAYIGSFKGNRSANENDEALPAIMTALRLLEVIGLPSVPVERVSDCRLICDAVHPLGFAVCLEQVHALWARHARRNGVEWMKPDGEVLLALQSAAQVILRKFSA